MREPFFQCQVCQHRIEIDRNSSTAEGIVAMKVDMLPCRWRDFLQKSQCFGVFARLILLALRPVQCPNPICGGFLYQLLGVCDSFATVKVRNLALSPSDRSFIRPQYWYGKTEISGSSPLPCSTSSGAFLQSAVVTDFTMEKKFLTAPTVTYTESNRWG